MTTAAKESNGEKRARHRSPAYPYIGLAEAVERVGVFQKVYRSGAASIEAASRLWGFKKTGSVPLQVVAALKYFGLMDDIGKGSKRQIRLTEQALRILLDQDETSPERLQALQKAALGPKIHAEMWEQWGAELPPDPQIKNYLLFEKKFNPEITDWLISEYKQAISFANLADFGTLPPMEGSKERTAPVVNPRDIAASAWPALLKKQPGLAPEREFSYCPWGQDENGQDRGARVLIKGQPTQVDIDDLIGVLQIAKRRLPKE